VGRLGDPMAGPMADHAPAAAASLADHAPAAAASLVPDDNRLAVVTSCLIANDRAWLPSSRLRPAGLSLATTVEARLRLEQRLHHCETLACT